jgi:thymidylate synthase (FAD)
MSQPRSVGILNYLLREKHGSPFEHTTLKFYVKAPIFVFREFHRHRIGFSYNEMSGRYTTLPPEFYIPADDRPLVNIGTSSKPDFAAGTIEQFNLAYSVLIKQYESAWAAYTLLLSQGVANEVARVVLPVGIFSQMYVTCNVRSLLSFLSLRTQDERATHRSRPQYEIELVARKMEALAAELFPETLAAYNKFGRVAP